MIDLNTMLNSLLTTAVQQAVTEAVAQQQTVIDDLRARLEIMEEQINGGGLDRRIEDCATREVMSQLENYDFDSEIESAINDYDFRDSINDAINDYDFTRAIEESGVVDHLLETDMFGEAVLDVMRNALSR